METYKIQIQNDKAVELQMLLENEFIDCMIEDGDFRTTFIFFNTNESEQEEIDLIVSQI